MEATPQATQREITLESLALVKARRPEVQVFNELLIQYPKAGTAKPGQVVPDNMIVVSQEPSPAEGSFDLPFEPAPPFCVLEYVSPNTRRKDFAENLGLTNSFISQVEHGYRNVSLDALGRIATYFGMTPSQLLEGIDARDLDRLR